MYVTSVICDVGSMFTYMEGTKVNLCVLDIDIIRDLLVSKSDCYSRNPAGWLWRNKEGKGRSLPDQLDKAKAPNVMSHMAPNSTSTLRRILEPGTDYDCNTVQVLLVAADWNSLTLFSNKSVYKNRG